MGILNDESIKNNFIFVSQILEESCETGIPQNTATSALRLVIKEDVTRSSFETDQVAIQATGKISHRKSGIHYDRNEIVLYVTEEIDLLMSSSGHILNSEIRGVIKAHCFLSGMPDCQLRLNEQIMMRNNSFQSCRRKNGSVISIEDWHFDQCVRTSELETGHSINFIPPDGDFELMNYRVSNVEWNPFAVSPLINELSSSKIEYKVTISSTYEADKKATNVVVIIPVPPNSSGAVLRVSSGAGHAKFEPENGGIVWKIPSFDGNTSYSLTGEVDLLNIYSRTQKVWNRPPISLDFQLRHMAVSGLQIKHLKIITSENYFAEKYALYVTKAGKYHIRF
eukprot:TRINITY_DN3121_c3_g2_i1.p1 TRINITY_DN3121_c3_g2~~TRINITY_DN3121_c3_g2_i1.p1  ORF type:complete len:338 (+),score=91.37 TRINITY_DN3121_c3_g2_i1:340-1353(+)